MKEGKLMELIVVYLAQLPKNARTNWRQSSIIREFDDLCQFWVLKIRVDLKSLVARNEDDIISIQMSLNDLNEVLSRKTTFLSKNKLGYLQTWCDNPFWDLESPPR